MAAKSTVNITFRMKGDKHTLKEMARDANGFRKVMSSTMAEAKQFNAKTINFAALAGGINAASNSLMQMQHLLQDLGDAYAVQEAAEKKLETVMRQRMGATNAEISSIKELASAQQALGIVGDEVQLSGAQQLATFLYSKKSLDTLIPAMNDLIAQQKGYEATTQDAVNIANMMGKVMMGQTAALKRVGISFSEAEGEVLMYGNEEEKTAMLAQVITNNVGHMNAELAKTDSGKLKQLNNTLGDYKETIGKITKQALPFLTIASQTAIAMGGVVTLTHGVRTLFSVLTMRNISRKFVASFTAMRATMRVFGAAMQGTAYKALALKLALKGLMITTGVGVAIAAVTTIIEKLALSSDEAADSEEKLADKMAMAKREMRDISKATADNSAKELAALEKLYNIASNESAARNKRTEAMKEMIRQYPAYFSGLDVEKINLSDLTTQYNLLRDSIIKVSRAKAAQTKIEENESERINIEETQRGLLEKKKKLQQAYEKAKADEAKAKAKFDKYQKEHPQTRNQDIIGLANAEKPWTDARKKTEAALKALNGVIDQRNELAHTYYELGKANKGLAEIASDVPLTPSKAPVISSGGGVGHVSSGSAVTAEETIKYKEDAKTLKEIEDNISYLREQLKLKDKEHAAATVKEIARWEDERDAIINAGKAIEENTLQWHDEAKTIAEVEDNIAYLESQRKTASENELKFINPEIKALEEKADAMRNYGIAAEEANQSAREGLGSAWSSVRQLGGGIESLTASLQGNKDAWQMLVGIVDSFFSIFDGMMQVIGMINMMTSATNQQTSAELLKGAAIKSTEAADTEAAMAAVANSSIAASASGVEATADMTAATAKVFKAHSWIPFVGVAMAAAMVATMIATMTQAKNSVPKFAKGGLAYGPTLGVFGEYSGARNNPEVVAPLDKLRGMLKPSISEGPGTVEFKIEGRQLVGILNKENNRRRRS